MKCFSPLELTHFKDNFFRRATEHDGLKYWNEKTLSDFLGIPDGAERNDSPSPLDAGPVIFRMVSYLGAFPFQHTMAPSLLTFEAMVKVVVLLTERYGKVLRRGHKDRIRLLFGSLADVGRKNLPSQSQSQSQSLKGDTEKDEPQHGFAVDEPAGEGEEEEEEDEDDLALAALESLDAIEVFRHDQRISKAEYEAQISADTFRRLLVLLLVIAPLKPLESPSTYTSDLSSHNMDVLQNEVGSIMATFKLEDAGAGIGYKTFATTVSTSLPYLFHPLTPLFEHFLFSKNLDLSQRREETVKDTHPAPPTSIMLPGSFKSAILDSTTLAHISFFLTCPCPSPDLFRSGARLHPVFSTAKHGSSLTSFSHNVLTWKSPSLLLLQGAVRGSSGCRDNLVTLGAYLPDPWSSAKPSSISHGGKRDFPCLFELSPRHTLFRGNPAFSAEKSNATESYFSRYTGIGVGCQAPPETRTHHDPPKPHGAGSLIVDSSLETAEFDLDPIITADTVFLPPSTLNKDSRTAKRIIIDVYVLEIWGFLYRDPEKSGAYTDALEKQRANWDFEAREAERRRNINLRAGAGQTALESARWLLETAGLTSDPAASGRQ